MARTLGRVPDHEFSSLLLNRPPQNMAPTIADRNLLPTNIIEISDDDDGDLDHDHDGRQNSAHPDFSAQSMPLRGTNPTIASTMNIRLKPDTSPTTWRDSKRQKLEDTPEASGSRSDYPRARLEFTDTDGGLAMAYPAFFDDAFVPNYANTSNSSPDTAVRLLQEAAVIQARQPPYFFDAKLNIRMYCGPGHEQFPLPVEYDQTFQDACDAFDAREWGHGDEAPHKDSPVTVAQRDCLARILDVFPDIQHKFVLDKIKSQHELIQFPDEEIEMHPDSAEIIHEILEMDCYPKQGDSEVEPQNEFEDRLGKPIVWKRDHYQKPNYKKDAVALLASHFDHVPTHYINSMVMGTGSLFDAYVLIEDIESDYFQGNRPYNRSKRPRVQLEKKYQTLDPQQDPPYYCSLVVELQAAKQHFLRKTLESNQKQQISDAETANLEQHRLDGLLVQCKCCFDEEVPMNRVVVCTAKEEHPFCYDCVKRLAENQIGMKRYQMQCMDESKCEQILDNDGIGKAVPIKTFDRLQFNQQQAEIKAANIEGLEQCPLCDFQAICDPPEINSVFSCQNPDCFKVTCRLCHEISHLPKTCEEVKKDRGLSARHKIEEARTQAMIRTCPNCQSAIVKSDGCNKMRCTCGGIICYACKADLSKLRDAYEHFDRGTTAGKKCPLYDDKTIDRHVQETNEAEEKAIQEAKAEDNTIEESTLRIETGKGKAVDRRGQRDAVQGGPVRELDYLFEENLQHPHQNALFEQVANEAGGREARRNRNGIFPRTNRIQWLNELCQRLPQAPLPVTPGFEPPYGGQPVQPAGPAGFNIPIAPSVHNLNQNPQHPFGNPFGNVGGETGQTRGRPTQQFFPGTPAGNFGYANLQNQNHGFNYHTGFGAFGQPPEPNDPDIIDNAYLNTAQRVHEARDQQERRRRSQIERRNTVHNEVPLRFPNPDILNVRNNHINFPPQPFQNHNNGLNNGTQQPVQARLNAAHRPSAVDVVMENTVQNDMNGDNDDDKAFEDFLRARKAFYDHNQGPSTNSNPNQHQNTTRDRARPPPLRNPNQDQNPNPTPGLMFPMRDQAATRPPHQTPNQPQPSAFGTQNYTQNQNQNQSQNRTQEWILGQTPAPPPWGITPGHPQNQNNVGVPGPVRLNRRQTMPLDDINNGNGFGNPNSRWA